MTIEYALTRFEIVRSFYQSLFASTKYLTTIAIYGLILGAIVAYGGVAARATPVEFALRFFFGFIGFLVLLPIMLFITAKTSVRSLTIAEEGISTSIGPISAQRQWNQINVIHETPDFVLLARTNGNAFYIPSRAFSDPAQKAEFIRLAKEWSKNE
ncbi:MAG TPA: YcxB family protein [Acidobacteriaceae bacterium]|nr:YcxB family protein [Acidobacteriaceae bacterium]